MSNQIVTVNVTLTIAPTPPTLQATGAFISQGATTLASGKSALLTQLSDLTTLLVGVLAVTSITQTAGLATMTTTAPHGIATSDVVQLTISGASPAAYNGVKSCTSTGANTLTFAIASGTTSPATGTIKYTPEDVAELLSMATTYFAQGANQGVYVLELGLGTPAEGVTALSAYITANPNSAYTAGATGFFYSYLVPRIWAGEPTFATFAAAFQSPTSKTYFFVTTTLANYTNFTNLDKEIYSHVEAPVVAANATSLEFTLAADFYDTLSYRPSQTNKVPPLAFTYVFGVTPYPTVGNNSQLATLLAAHVNYTGTGAEGGISNAIIRNGTTMDGRGFTYWYSVDALQIYSDINIANAIINGSNNPQNPLYYNQDGIDRLQAVEVRTMNSLVSWGLANGQVVQSSLNGTDLVKALNAGTFNGKIYVNAVPFVDYLTINPGDYKIGEYDGLTAGYITQNGFIHIIFTVNVSDFIATQ